MSAGFSEWIGRTESTEELIGLAPVQAAAATLDDTSTEYTIGSPLPPLWHWFFFLPRAQQSQLGPDGHSQRGGFMPPIDLPRRMFAGARTRFVRPLVIGEFARRQSVIRDVSEKAGRSGKLAFVTVSHQIEQAGNLCIEEEQDIVYREPGGPVAAPEAMEGLLPSLGSWSRRITPDPALLFRFSAVTFNAHRIHYDRDYATNVEGYPGLVVQGQLVAILLVELVRAHSPRPISSFAFRGLAPLFDLAPFWIIATPEGQRVRLEAHGPDGKTTMTAEAELA
jgi:3-methylfumaryl-CoA hydratase